MPASIGIAPVVAFGLLVKSRLAVPTVVKLVGFGGGTVGPGMRLVCVKSAGKVAAKVSQAGWKVYQIGLPSVP